MKKEKNIKKIFKKFYFKYFLKSDCLFLRHNSDFEEDDLAIYDKDGTILLCTTTHEGNISVHKKYI